MLTEASSNKCTHACVMSIRYDDTLTGTIPEEGTKHILFGKVFCHKWHENERLWTKHPLDLAMLTSA